MPRGTFLGIPRKMLLPLAEDLCGLICKAGKGCFMCATDVGGAYRQLPLDTKDWPIMFFNFDSSFFFDLSLSFGLRSTASHYQDVMSLHRKLGLSPSALDSFQVHSLFRAADISMRTTP